MVEIGRSFGAACKFPGKSTVLDKYRRFWCWKKREYFGSGKLLKNLVLEN
jgi:hypothetical protein